MFDPCEDSQGVDTSKVARFAGEDRRLDDGLSWTVTGVLGREELLLEALFVVDDDADDHEKGVVTVVLGGGGRWPREAMLVFFCSELDGRVGILVCDAGFSGGVMGRFSFDVFIRPRFFFTECDMVPSDLQRGVVVQMFCFVGRLLTK